MCHNSSMQNIQIPDDQYQELTARAQAAGFADVPALISALAGEPFEDPRGPLTTEQLKQSAMELEAADAEIDAGKGIEVDEAFGRIADKHGFNLPE